MKCAKKNKIYTHFIENKIKIELQINFILFVQNEIKKNKFYFIFIENVIKPMYNKGIRRKRNKFYFSQLLFRIKMVGGTEMTNENLSVVEKIKVNVEADLGNSNLKIFINDEYVTVPNVFQRIHGEWMPMNLMKIRMY